ncbi:membrane cofactor protein-like [Ctenodactylus gundi]
MEPHGRLFPSHHFLEILLVALVVLPSTSSAVCGEPLTYTTMDLVGTPKPQYNAGDRVDYKCKPGYQRQMNSPTFAVCSADGKWPPLSNDACSKKSCPVATDPLNGRVNPLNGSFEVGNQVQFVCNEGYDLIGKKILHCVLQDSKVLWSDNAPLCEKVLCQPPPKIRNGKYSSSKDVFEYLEVVTYSCDKSTGPDEFSLVGESQIYCVGRGQWSGGAPECKVVKCPYPVIENGRQTSGFGKKYYYGATVTFECTAGLYLHGNNTVACDADNTWRPPIPTCRKEPLQTSTKPPVTVIPAASQELLHTTRKVPGDNATIANKGQLDFENLGKWVIILIVITLLE